MSAARSTALPPVQHRGKKKAHRPMRPEQYPGSARYGPARPKANGQAKNVWPKNPGPVVSGGAEAPVRKKCPMGLHDPIEPDEYATLCRKCAATIRRQSRSGVWV